MISDEKRREVAEQLRGARPTTYYAEELVETIKDAMLPAFPTETWTEPTDVLSALADLIEPSDEAWRNGYDVGFASADDWYAQHTDEELAEHGLKRERTCRIICTEDESGDMTEMHSCCGDTHTRDAFTGRAFARCPRCGAKVVD